MRASADHGRAVSDQLIDLGSDSDPQVVGGKAAALSRAVDKGYRVPPGIVVPVAVAAVARTDEEWRELVSGVRERLGGIVAVRSSAVAEDGSDASYAGQYDTVLGVGDDDGLVGAIHRCLASARSATAQAYEAQRDGAGPAMAVLIQHMIEPVAAGVAFSADPVSGRDEVVIEAVAGTGDRLLAGEESGERWVVGAHTCAATSPTVLGPEQADEIARLASSLDAAERGPVDIEWAHDGNEIHLLQVRPITALPLEPAARPPVGQTFVREPRFDRPLHPLSFTTWLPRHSEIWAGVFERFGVPVSTIDNRHFYGRVYGRLVPLMDRGTDGGAEPPAWVMRLLFHLAPPIRRRLSRARAFDTDAALTRLLDAWDARGRGKAQERTTALRTVDLTALDDPGLADHLDDVLHHIVQVGTAHFELVVAGNVILMGRLGLLVEELLGWEPHEIVTLVQGFGDASTEHGRALDALADATSADELADGMDDPESLRAHPAVAAYLDRHGHRINIDLTTPTEAEDLALLVDHLRRHTAERSTGSPVEPKSLAREAEQRALDQLETAGDRARFESALALARRGRPYGDETELVVLDAVTLVRFVALEAGRRFAAAGRLRSAPDVWFLEQEELSALLRSPSAPTPDLDRRIREHRWALANDAPDLIGPPPAPPPPIGIIPKRHRATVGAALWAFDAADPVFELHDDELDDAVTGNALRGIPGSPGTATGTVRIVRDIADFGRIEPGDIVVCPTTIAAWSPIFPVIGGLVTERGGPLSHPATLAREYGLPAVLSLRDATRRLADGTRVRVDGGHGTVAPH